MREVTLRHLRNRIGAACRESFTRRNFVRRGVFLIDCKIERLENHGALLSRKSSVELLCIYTVTLPAEHASFPAKTSSFAPCLQQICEIAG